MTHRNVFGLVVVALAPGAVAAVGDALYIDGRVLAVLVWVAWVGCVAACARIAIGWRSR